MRLNFAKGLFVFLLTLSFPSYSLNKINIAIIDNFKYQKYVTTKYKKYYVEGLEVAIREARRKGIKIEYKIFQYDEEPLSIIGKVQEAIKWKPDLIIGPRDSNKFLMLAPYIKGILTVSPFATSLAVSGMPKNFFSTTLSDAYEAKAIYDFIRWQFSKKSFVILSEEDCRSCHDVAVTLNNLFSQSNKNNIYNKYLISSQVSNISLSDVKDINEEKIYILPNNAHVSAVLMARISQLNNHKSIFIGGDGWGSWEDTEVGKLGEVNSYEAYHVVPWGIEICSSEANKFKNNFYLVFGEMPKNKLSFVVYQTIMSVVISSQQFARSLNGSNQDVILESYELAVKKNKYLRKPSNYFVYKIYKGNNSVFKVVNPVSNRINNYICKKDSF